jgi:imidazolonepropionase-like amidohydrolase
MSDVLTQAPTLFLNARLIDGNGGDPVEGAAVQVEGNRITLVGRTSDFPPNPDGNRRVIDLGGKTLMPGLVEAHSHVSYWGAKDLPDLDLKLAPENSTIYAVKNCELMLRCGFTAASSAGAVHRVDVTIRDAINDGIIPGPRLMAAGRDICGTGGMLDWNPSFWKLGMDGLGIFADGVDEVRKAVRSVIRDGADVIKLYMTGEGLLRRACRRTTRHTATRRSRSRSRSATDASARSPPTRAGTTASSRPCERASTTSSTRRWRTTKRSR